MAKVGLKDAYYAIMTKDEIGSITYDVPVRLKNIQQAQVNPKVNTAQAPGDDVIAESVTQCIGADVTVQRLEFTPVEEKILLGRVEDADGGIYGGTTDNPPYVAFGYKRTFVNQSEGLYTWILKTKFAPSNMTADTKPVDGVTMQYDSMTASALTRQADGQWIYSRKSSDPNFGATFFSKATLERLANAVNQTYGQPATVSAVATLPETGTPGVIYHLTTDDTHHYWDGSKFVEI
ncbi:major tail protein [Clostridium sp. BNL1100]|uniref:major tail protein n=1 Tax=Clostridium sp. BNL1100 TaxID=755731 RepID=UPI00024A7F15|nr:major tail protein [Clostridium sp. BNL1100]AEY65422.1 phage major tail protein, phi13 family [Clostridium sp. BNL1100]